MKLFFGQNGHHHRTLGKQNTKGGTPPTHTQPTQQVTPSLILLSKIGKNGIYNLKFNKENNVFKDALGVKGLGFKHHRHTKMKGYSHVVSCHSMTMSYCMT